MNLAETLGLNLRDFIWHSINFVVLIFLLSRFLYKPIVGMLDDRRERIRESMERAEQVRLETERSAQEREARLAETRRQIQDMLAQATQTAERIHSDAREKAQQEAQRIVERAQQEAEAERTASMAELRREVANLAVAAAERVISRSLDDQAHRQLVEAFLAEQPGDGKPA